MTSATPETGFYRWIIVLCSFLILFVSNGMTIGGITVFDLEVLASLSEQAGREVSLGELKIRDGWMFLTAGILGMGAGWLADKVGVKPLIIVGLALLALCNFAYSQVQSLDRDLPDPRRASAWCWCLCGLMINVYLISRWFEKGRGLAIGLVLAGTSLGNAFFPQLNTWLNASMDELAGSVPVPRADSAGTPAGGNLRREGVARWTRGRLPAAPQPSDADLPGYTLGEALRSRNFWIICTLAFCTFYSILGMTAVTFVFLRVAEYPAQLAATGVTILFIGGLVGKIIAGYLAETLGRKPVLLVGLGLMLIGAIALFLAVLQGDEIFIWVGLVGFGFGWGGIYTLIQLLSADLFGLKSLGKILGAVNVLDTFGGAMGPVLTAMLYDRTGSFLVSFGVIVVMLLVATTAAAFLRMADAAYMRKNTGNG